MASTRMIRCALLQMAIIAGARIGPSASSKFPAATLSESGRVIDGRLGSGEERVDSNIVGSSGDLSLDPSNWIQSNQLRLLQEAELPVPRAPVGVEPIIVSPDGRHSGLSLQYGLVPAGALVPRNYQTLVDDFKQSWLQVANPARESRAFKPRLMSTARGFGKRTQAGPLDNPAFASVFGPAKWIIPR